MSKIASRCFFYLFFCLLGCSSLHGGVSSTELKGLNYDPNHNWNFFKARALSDQNINPATNQPYTAEDVKTLMENAIKGDLDNIKKLNAWNDQHDFVRISYIKTFFTSFSSLDSTKTGGGPLVAINMADVLHDWNAGQQDPDKLKIDLGVYCQPGYQWTQVDVDAVKAAIQEYKDEDFIQTVVVGNENFGAGDTFLQQQLEFILQIRTCIGQKGSKVKLSTAQQADSLISFFNSKGATCTKYMNALDSFDATLYAFWVLPGTPYNTDPGKFPKQWNSDKITSVQQAAKSAGYPGDINIAEEAWPSGGEMPWPTSQWPNQPDWATATLAAAKDYYYYWGARGIQGCDHCSPGIVEKTAFFQTFNNFPGMGMNSFWGVYSQDGSSNMLENPSKSMDGNNFVTVTIDTSDLQDPIDIHLTLLEYGATGGANVDKNNKPGFVIPIFQSEIDAQGHNYCYGYIAGGDENNSRLVLLPKENAGFGSTLQVTYDASGSYPGLGYIALVDVASDGGAITIDWDNGQYHKFNFNPN